MTLHLQSNDERDIELFFELLSPNIAIGLNQFEVNSTKNATFRMNFRELQKCVTNPKNVTPILPKQDLSVNADLVEVIAAHRKAGLSFQEIAYRMNKEGYRNSRGNMLNKMQVSRLYKNLKAGETEKAV